MSLLEQTTQWLKECGQEHLLRFYDDLSVEHQSQLLAHLQRIRQEVDLAHMNRVFAASMAALAPSSSSVSPPAADDFFFVTDQSLRDAGHAAHVAALRQTGLDAIGSGKVAVLVLAGGSGTRLGQTFPKGMLVCPELKLEQSLFQLQCEKILRMESLAKCAGHHTHIPLVLMTSPQTDAQTRDFLGKHGYFGLRAEQVHFFVQSAIPCYSREGKVLLESKCTVSTAPGGNGGIYAAFSKSGLLDFLRRNGTEYVQIVTVDNMLVKLADPILVGYAIEQEADVVVKSTPKVSDSESVGVFAKRDGSRWGVVEYTEIGAERASARDSNGNRVYDCANIAIHLLHVSFLERASDAMKTYEWYHAALKTIPTVDGPVDGVKLEAFIFDLFEFSKKFKILQVDRAAEFSPIKNSDDATHSKADTPHTAVQHLLALHTSWVRAAATSELRELIDAKALKFEISPLASFAGENLDGYLSSIEVAARDAAEGAVLPVLPSARATL